MWWFDGLTKPSATVVQYPKNKWAQQAVLGKKLWYI